MLLEFGLRNFKAFGDKEQKASMSKITLIYGPNSGGKSSIIQALLMLKQSLDSEQDSGRRELVPRGEYVDLGSFSALLHKHAIANRELGISIKFLTHTQKTGYGVQMTFVEPEPKESATKDSSFLSEVRYQILDRNSLLLDAKLKYKSNKNSWDMLRLLITKKNNPEMFSKIKNRSNVFLPTLELQAEERILKLRQQYTQKPGLQQKLELELISGLIQELIWALIWWTPMQKQGQEQEDLKPLLTGLGPFAQYLEGILEQIPEQIPDLIQELELVHILMLDIEPPKILDITPTDIPLSYNDLLNSITYLGPLRSYPERLYTVSGWDRNSVGVRGELTTHILYQDSNIIEEVNKWFERFEIPYRLEIREFGDVQLVGKYVSIALEDKRTKTSVTLADVGFGINQLLPVIIESMVSQPNAIICVEQPEIHLHPRLQANIADLMIETSKGEDEKQWIVETHSELLIRRIQRRIREGTLNPNDVSVLYVDPGDDGSKKVSQLGLNRIKKITLHLSPNHVFSTYAHDRYIRFDGITCVIGKGIEVFRNKKINANSTFAFKSSQFIQDSRSIEKALRDNKSDTSRLALKKVWQLVPTL